MQFEKIFGRALEKLRMNKEFQNANVLESGKVFNLFVSSRVLEIPALSLRNMGNTD